MKLEKRNLKNAERWGNSYSHWEKSIKSMKTFAKKEILM